MCWGVGVGWVRESTILTFLISAEFIRTARILLYNVVRQIDKSLARRVSAANLIFVRIK